MNAVVVVVMVGLVHRALGQCRLLKMECRTMIPPFHSANSSASVMQNLLSSRRSPEAKSTINCLQRCYYIEKF
eukprot:6102016-Amphidinium_carterae.2